MSSSLRPQDLLKYYIWQKYQIFWTKKEKASSVLKLSNSFKSELTSSSATQQTTTYSSQRQARENVNRKDAKFWQPLLRENTTTEDTKHY